MRKTKVLLSIILVVVISISIVVAVKVINDGTANDYQRDENGYIIFENTQELFYYCGELFSTENFAEIKYYYPRFFDSPDCMSVLDDFIKTYDEDVEQIKNISATEEYFYMLLSNYVIAELMTDDCNYKKVTNYLNNIDNEHEFSEVLTHIGLKYSMNNPEKLKILLDKSETCLSFLENNGEKILLEAQGYWYIAVDEKNIGEEKLDEAFQDKEQSGEDNHNRQSGD